MPTERNPLREAQASPPRKTHRLRRHPAVGQGLRYLAGFHNRHTQVVLKAVNQPGRPEYRVGVVGMLEQVSLIVECPMIRGIPALGTGEALEVRLFAVRDLVLFQCEMLTASTYPGPYLHLSWPQELCVLQVRSSARVTLDKPATFGLQVDRQLIPVPGHIIDLSTEGAAFLCDALGAVVGDQGELVLVLEVDGKLPPVFVHPRVVVRSVREPLHAGGCLQYGLEFLDLALDEALAIRAFLGLREALD